MVTNRLIVALILGVSVLASAALTDAAELKPIHTQKTKDVVVTLASEPGNGNRARTSSCWSSTRRRTRNRSMPARSR